MGKCGDEEVEENTEYTKTSMVDNSSSFNQEGIIDLKKSQGNLIILEHELLVWAMSRGAWQ